ncbi:16S rRNA (guanine(966)-N(2))-methyltransferase RsmD [Candidatus Bipolaricaulota bacterium]|nr:16S rRNA (guanine(966)-N(2))-methyltransferase RsmD [Candidatus Bipolaricaulota bacterium]
MRITGGAKRGRKLVSWEEAGIRPMRDFVRTALFNILADLVPGSRFLDLFCGTGSVGLEALSRGAVECVFLDSSAGACGIVRRNLDALDLLKQGKVIKADFREGIDRLVKRGRQFDLVFVGPPYEKGLAAAALDSLGEGLLLANEALIVTETHKKEELSSIHGKLQLTNKRTYGDNVLWFYHFSSAIPVGKRPKDN